MLICRNHPDVAEGVRRCARCGVAFCSDCLVDIAGRPYCATCKNEQLLDVRSGVDRTALNLASPWKRFGAMIIDNMIIGIPLMIVVMAIIFGAIGLQGMASDEPPLWVNFIGLPFMFVHPLYEGLMMQMKDGQTLGKMALKLRVVRPDGSPISSGQAWGRAGLRLVFGCLYIVDYIPAFFTAEKTTLHDMAANTRVIDIV